MAAAMTRHGDNVEVGVECLHDGQREVMAPDPVIDSVTVGAPR